MLRFHRCFRLPRVGQGVGVQSRLFVVFCFPFPFRTWRLFFFMGFFSLSSRWSPTRLVFPDFLDIFFPPHRFIFLSSCLHLFCFFCNPFSVPTKVAFYGPVIPHPFLFLKKSGLRPPPFFTRLPVFPPFFLVLDQVFALVLSSFALVNDTFFVERGLVD